MNIIPFDNYIAEINSDSELNALIFRLVYLMFSHGLLNRERVLNCRNRAWKFHQNAIAHRLDDTPPMLSNFGVNYFSPQRL